MNADLNVQTASMAMNNGTAAAQAALGTRNATAQKAATEFESVFLSQMLGHMFSGIESDEEFGGGAGENMFRSLMIDEYAKKITAGGGIGLADNVLKELVKTQEHAS